MAEPANSTNTSASQQGPVTGAIAAMRQEPEPPRRGFLRGLLSLPLIGGGVTLIGNPTAVAEPVSDVLKREYANWLAYERSQAFLEAYGHDNGDWYELRGAAYRWHRERGDRKAASVPPSTRAALVLSAVGCDWRG